MKKDIIPIISLGAGSHFVLWLDVTCLNVGMLSELRSRLSGVVDVSYIDDIIERRCCSASFYNGMAINDAGFKRRKSRGDKFRGK